IRPGKITGVDDDELRPVDALVEPHRGDAAARRGAADGGAPQEVAQGQIVHVALAAGELGETFAPVHRRRILEDPRPHGKQRLTYAPSIWSYQSTESNTSATSSRAS